MRPTAIRVEVFSGRVCRGDLELSVNPREMALLLTLVSARRPWSGSDLQAALWPDAQPAAARNALGVCVHRLRKALGDPTAVLRTAAGYTLGLHVGVDLWEAEELERELRRCPDLCASQRRAAQTLLATFLAGGRVATDGLPLETLEGFALRAESVHRSLAMRLAQDALQRRDATDALRCTAAMLEADPCDEAACEFAMRAHLLHDDRSSAIREYRTYRRVVSSELDLQPSPHLLAMLA